MGRRKRLGKGRLGRRWHPRLVHEREMWPMRAVRLCRRGRAEAAATTMKMTTRTTMLMMTRSEQRSLVVAAVAVAGCCLGASAKAGPRSRVTSSMTRAAEPSQQLVQGQRHVAAKRAPQAGTARDARARAARARARTRGRARRRGWGALELGLGTAVSTARS
ncbi:hypothetical protein BC831DRAFT_163750 [Entophlyctis helioformis]|nr:hypothetical protein BC831DRAFT_163750 [Entophlyctis helioformis]